jgi:hypothetical protein
MSSDEDTAQARKAKYGAIPPPIVVEQTITSQETALARDPENGRDTERDFMMRHLGA